MNLGHGFVVTIQDKDAEKQLMKLLTERIDNYPIVCKIKTPTVKYEKDGTTTTIKPMQYLISSRDNVFLKFDDASRLTDIPFGLSVRPANSNDVWRLRHGFRYCYNKPFIDAVFR